MRKLLSLVLVFAVVLAVSVTAYAAEKSADKKADKAAAAPAAPAAPAAATPATPPAIPGVKTVLKGKVSSKMVDRRGKQVKSFEIAVTEGKDAEGKVVADLKGKTVALRGREAAASLEKFDGKDAEVTGLLRDGKQPGVKVLAVQSVK